MPVQVLVAHVVVLVLLVEVRKFFGRFDPGWVKEVQIVYRLFLVNCYILHVPRLPSQQASNWLELARQYIAMTRNNLSII